MATKKSRWKSRFIPRFEELEPRDVPTTYNWVGGHAFVGTDWGSAVNWKVGGQWATTLPGKGDTVIFDGGSTTDCVLSRGTKTYVGILTGSSAFTHKLFINSGLEVFDTSPTNNSSWAGTGSNGNSIRLGKVGADDSYLEIGSGGFAMTGDASILQDPNETSFGYVYVDSDSNYVGGSTIGADLQMQQTSGTPEVDAHIYVGKTPQGGTGDGGFLDFTSDMRKNLYMINNSIDVYGYAGQNPSKGIVEFWKNSGTDDSDGGIDTGATVTIHKGAYLERDSGLTVTRVLVNAYVVNEGTLQVDENSRLKIRAGTHEVSGASYLQQNEFTAQTPAPLTNLYDGSVLTVQDDFIQTAGSLRTYSGTHGNIVKLDVTGTYHLNTGSVVLGYNALPASGVDKLEVTNNMNWGETGGGKAEVNLAYDGGSGANDKLVVDGALAVKSWDAMSSTGAYFETDEINDSVYGDSWTYNLISYGSITGAGTEDWANMPDSHEIGTFYEADNTNPWTLQLTNP